MFKKNVTYYLRENIEGVIHKHTPYVFSHIVQKSGTMVFRMLCENNIIFKIYNTSEKLYTRYVFSDNDVYINCKDIESEAKKYFYTYTGMIKSKIKEYANN